MMRLIGSTLIAAALLASSPVQAQKSTLLVLDASGSMNARLPDGQTRIDAARKAVADLVARMDAGTRLALRAYGHQSATQQKDCKDTALLVGFAPMASNRAEVVAQAQAIQARGYTPITHALTAAAQDIASEESGERIIMLVSDGQETCASDPCVAARALAAADARLVIHTIGFGVGAAARTQLQCIANVARGRYFDANSAASLASTMSTAAQTKAVEQKSTGTTVRVAKPTPSRILIKNTWAGASHPVTRAEDGVQVADINGANGRADVPPGIYNVGFANGIWRGVEVKAGETTVLEVGLLRVEHGANDLNGYNILDPETEEVLVRSKVISSLPLMPGRFIVSSGHAGWPMIEINAGQTTVLNPGRIEVKGDKAGTYDVKAKDGGEVGQVSRLLRLPLPPGSYIVNVEGQEVTVDLTDGQTHTIAVE
jgi:Mg-chelatase subunit ChlD